MKGRDSVAPAASGARWATLIRQISRRSARIRGRLELVELDLLVDRRTPDPEDLGRLRLVPLRPAERAFDGFALDLGEGRRRSERARVAERGRHVGRVGDVRDVDVVGSDRRAL